MKQGRYFRIPECQADVERLWAETPPAQELPTWLAPAGLTAYRCVATATTPDTNEHERMTYFDELEQLEAASLVIDDVETARPGHAIYVPRPRADEPWAIGMYEGSSPLDLRCLDGAVNPVLTRDAVTDAPASFVADPFMIRVDGRWYMFFEVMNWRTNKGEIALATSDDGMAWRYERLVLVEPFHLSYPFVFESDGSYYMVPESSQAAAVRLYRARRFPFEWELEDVLLTGAPFVDSCPIHHEGRWWLFTTPTLDNNALWLYHSEHLRGPWRAHAASPLVSGDKRLARSAGRCVPRHDGVVRYAQDCEHDYGTAVRAIVIRELATGSYAEDASDARVVIAPGQSGWNAGGMHHIDAHQLTRERWIACVDGRSRDRS